MDEDGYVFVMSRTDDGITHLLLLCHLLIYFVIVPCVFKFALSAASTVRIKSIICSDTDAAGADGAAGELFV